MSDGAADKCLPEVELHYFNEQVNESNPEYWRRLGAIDFEGKTVLDIGCGHGALSLHAAQHGAARVVGVDIDKVRIDFARRNLELNYPNLLPIVDFVEGELENITELFDIAISKDSFEHISDLATVMRMIAARLSEGGLLVTGFSPLYFSPFGDHGRYFPTRTKIPWLPVILPEPVLFRLASRHRSQRISTASDVGLNKLTPADFRRIISDQGWDVVAWHTNRGDKRGMRTMRALARFGPLEKFLTVNIYAQLRKPSERTKDQGVTST